MSRLQALRASSFYEQIKAEIEAMLATAREIYADGHISVKEWRRLGVEVLRAAKRIAAMVDESQVSREQLFIDVCVSAWEDLGKPFDIPGVPDFLEDALVDPIIEKLIEYGAGVIYEYLAGQLAEGS